MQDGKPVVKVDDFYKLLRLGIDRSSLDNIDFEELDYVIYARKSTIGDERQEHSIDDQIALCIDICIKPNRLNLASLPIREKGSAKEPDIRKKFNKMIQDVKDGKIDGIISYHPDRLSRNMKEAGELIDLLDKGILKDLRFATSNFENSPTGKMLLGMSFVLSKQYSENLSQNVTRGNIRATEERGQFLGKRVHGYYITKDKQLVTDGEHFISIQRAFGMRLEGATQPQIAKWLNTQGYKVRYKGKEARACSWNKAKVSDLLKNPVYAGVLKYGRSLVKLGDFYDFTPALSVEEFLTINRISDLTSDKLTSAFQGNKAGNIRANLMRGMVRCYECNKLMSSGINTKYKKDQDGKPVYDINGSRTIDKERYYYRCETEDCIRLNKSVRAKVVVSAAIEALNTHLFTSKGNYKSYKDDANESLRIKSADLNGQIARLSQQLGYKKLEYDRARQYKVTDPHGVGKHFDLDETRSELELIKSDLEVAKNTREQLKTSILTYKKYLELFENLGKIIEVGMARSMSMSALDGILRKFFSNFVLKAEGDKQLQWSVESYKLNEPWGGFIKDGNVRHGRDDRT